MIYFLEDDDSIRELVIYTLRNTGMEAMGFPRPSAFWEAMQQEELPALVLLDIMLPEEDGVSVLKKLRANRATKTLPVIMLTAKGEDMDKILGLEYGADDYITKPFNILEVKARIKAIMRRAGSDHEEKEILYGDMNIREMCAQWMYIFGDFVKKLKQLQVILNMCIQNGESAIIFN